MATVLIKKYGNRRLYDTGDSRYLTLDELAAKVRGGTDVRVVDDKTGEDLTQVTLTQIILESKDAARMLPAPLLMQLVRLGDDALAEFFGRYVTAALDTYLQARRGVQSLAGLVPFNGLPMAAGDALARMFMASPFAHGFAPAASPPPAPAPAPETTESDLAALRREMEELRRQVGEVSKKRRR